MKLFLYALLVTFFSCKSGNKYYHGRVLDENNKPIENVFVVVDRFEEKSKTNEKGYFKLKRNPDWLGNLIFFKEGYITDTIPSFWHQHGKTIQYNFIEDDTTVLRLKRIK